MLKSFVRIPPISEHNNNKNVPVTPPDGTNSTALLLPRGRSYSFPSSRCLKSASRLCMTSFKINKCLTRNKQPSRILLGGFRFLRRSEAVMSDRWQKESASCAMSSNIAGYNPRSDGWFDMKRVFYVHTLTKSCSCASTHTVVRRVGYHVSCLSSEGTRKIWLTLSFSIISVPFNSLFAAK